MTDVKSGRVVWRQDLDFHSVVGSGYELNMSGHSGPVSGGSPMELMLAAVAGCTAMDVISILQKKRQKVTDFCVEITGLRAKEHPKVYTEIDILYVVSGIDVDPKAVERSIELSQTRYCSASIMLKEAGITVRTAYRIESVEPALLEV